MSTKFFSLMVFSAAVMGYAQTPIAYVPVEGATVSGALEVSDGRAAIGSNGTITAGARAVQIALPARGELRLCSSSTVHLTSDRSVATSQAGLLMALARGAVEVQIKTGKFSDVLMTPDFRILLSGPGAADLRVRVNDQGDTCVENHGENAPYVTVSSVFEGGAYRVQADQRVLFEHGSLQDVVDREKESCGCPPLAAPGNNSFPVAVSEGLAKPPVAAAPAGARGATTTKVTAKLAYDGQTGQTSSVEAPEPAHTAPETKPATIPAVIEPTEEKKAPSRGNIFHRIGHFFGHLFGK